MAHPIARDPWLRRGRSARPPRRARICVDQLENRSLLTAFTMMSPIAPAPLLDRIAPAGGIVLDLVGINGGRIETALTPSELFKGDFSTGTPSAYRGNPGTLGIQTGLTPSALLSLGGGLAGIAVRVTMDDGGTAAGGPSFRNNQLLLNGVPIGDFSDVPTEETTPDGLTSLSSNPDGGFRSGKLDTGFFTSTDSALLSALYTSIVKTGQVVYGFRDDTPYDQSLDFTAGLDASLIDPGKVPVFAINPPFFTSVTTTSPIDEGATATITAVARIGHQDPHHPPKLTYQFDVNGDGTYDITNDTGIATLSFDRPGSYTVPIRVYTEQGTVATTRATVVVRNVAPTLRSPGDQVVDEGSNTPIALGSFTDAGLDAPWTATVDWGDGSPVQVLTLNQTGDLGAVPHAYEQDGRYEVSLRLTDSLGAEAEGHFAVDVRNVAPTIDRLGLAPQVFQGDTASLSLDFTDPGLLDTFSLSIDWGDGEQSKASLAAGVRSFAESHVFGGHPGSRLVTVTITDQGGDTSFRTTSIQVLNVAPSVTSTEVQDAVEGSPAPISLGRLSDPGPDAPWTINVNWGDGSPAQVLMVTQTGDLGSLLHTYEKDGPYTVTLGVTDDFGAASLASFSVDVRNVAPTIDSMSVTPRVRPGEAADLSLRFSDPGLLDTFSLAIAWGDGSALRTPLGSGTRSFAGSHAFGAGGGSYLVSVVITDDGGGQAFGSATVLVQPVSSPLTPAPGPSPGAAPEISPLDFFNNASKKASVAASFRASNSVFSFRARPLAQSLIDRHLSFGDGGGETPTAPGGRTLEELIAILRGKATTFMPGRSGRGPGAQSSAARQLAAPGAGNEEVASLTSKPPGQAPTEEAQPTSGQARPPRGRAGRLLMLVAWLALSNQRRWRRFRRSPSAKTRNTTPGQV